MFQYQAGNKTIIIAVTFLLTACSTADCRNLLADNKVISQPVRAADVVVKACQGNLNILALLNRYSVQIKRQVSPQIVVVEWRDNRSPEEVIHELRNSGKFCGVQENFQVQMMEKKK